MRIRSLFPILVNFGMLAAAVVRGGRWHFSKVIQTSNKACDDSKAAVQTIGLFTRRGQWAAAAVLATEAEAGSPATT